MEVTISGRHLEITEPIREYAAGKMAKLPRYYDRLQAVQVVAEKNEHQFMVEVRVQADRHDPFIAKESGTDLYACIDATVDKLERQLTDHKDRLRNRKHNKK
ncbi:MAG: ribosome-associated translation inhibitor RaiA [Phycisphaeraceae bacterium]|nr:ribosome-associated translation inhibitor RaiA [Phycisphaeraceae bacterium]